MRISRLLGLLLVALAALLAFPRGALAQDALPASEIEARKRTLRTLSPEDRQALKSALERFRKLPREQRETLRKKAGKLGEDRLRALGGRDVRKLRERHGHVREELDEIKEFCGFEQATAGLTPSDRRYLEHRITRGFHHYIKNKLLSPEGTPFDPEEIAQKTPDERRAWMRARMDRAVLRLLPAEERPAYENASERDRNRMRKDVIRGFRERQRAVFASSFRERDITMFLNLPPQERARVVREFKGRMRFFEMARRLERDLEVSPEILALVRQLPRSEWRTLRDRLADLHQKGESIVVQRLEMEQLIRRRHAMAASDSRPRLERRRKDRRRDGAGPRGRDETPDDAQKPK